MKMIMNDLKKLLSATDSLLHSTPEYYPHETVETSVNIIIHCDSIILESRTVILRH